MMREWLYKTIGEVGAIGVLAVAVLAYIIWRFNPVFRLPAKKIKGPDEAGEALPEEISEKVEWPVAEEKEEESETLSAAGKANTLKGNAGMMNSPVAEENTLQHAISMVEKEELPADEPIVVPPVEVKPIILPEPVVTEPVTKKKAPERAPWNWK